MNATAESGEGGTKEKRGTRQPVKEFSFAKKFFFGCAKYGLLHKRRDWAKSVGSSTL